MKGTGTVAGETLARADWQARAEAHAERVDVWTVPHVERRAQGITHPVHDFLFTYYSQRPAALRRWHPGYGVRLLDAPEYVDQKGYGVTGGVAAVSPAHLARDLRVVRQTLGLQRAIAARAPTLGCFGLHEWAMVHGTDDIRHAWPLRLGSARTDEVVESHKVGCSHFDAFRFFTPTAVPLNTLQPGRDDRVDFEQPGCLHAGMDLYKSAFRLTPLIPSELVADCFALAWDIRILDMRAAPYDFTGVTLDPTGEPWTPVPIETPAGKVTYVALQRSFAERAVPLRARLIAECERLLDSA